MTVAARALRCAVPIAVVRAEPAARARATSELLYGETVRAVDDAPGEGEDGFVEVEAARDGYRGFVARDALAPTDGAPSPTHRVVARASLAFAEPEVKSPPVHRLPFGALLALASATADATALAAGGRDAFVETVDGLWLRAAHLAARDAPERVAPLAIARERFAGAPYLWGGRTPDGCDCSGLVQSVHETAGLALPRDSGDQERALATRVGADDVRAGDLVFWPGHVAIALDATRVLHANAWTLSVAEEPLAAVVARAGAPSSVRRPVRER